MKYLLFFSAFIALGCQMHLPQENGQNSSDKTYNVQKSASEWKAELTAEEYRILREKGTERAFTGTYDKFYKDGTYHCAGCQQSLFSSETKFNSRTGWPSFYEPIKTENVDEIADLSLGMKRVEVVCSNCGGHLGHVFEDGPKPTGLRYCINSVSLDFVEEEADLDQDEENAPDGE